MRMVTKMERFIYARVWECVEIAFTASTSCANPFLEVQLKAEFAGPNGERQTIPAYWDGDSSWKVRFAPATAGEWDWKSVCSNGADSGLHGQEGKVTATAWSSEELAANPNRRGFIRVHKDGRYFEYADGTPFYWLGDTLWAAHTTRCDTQDALPRYLKDRQNKGFTVIQMVVGHPTGDLQDEDGGCYVNYSAEAYLNEGGAPYSRRYDLINPEYFRHLDRRMRLMADMGFVPCIMAMWGQELKAMTVQAAKSYWRYIVARYGAYNVTWSLAGEYLFTWDVDGWRELGEEIDRFDPYAHPTSAHSVAPHSGSQHYHGEDWYDYNLIQVGHVLAFKSFVEHLPIADYNMKPAKPAIMSESWYENHPNRVFDDGIRIGAREVRFASYVPLLQGCVGQTYGAHGIWSFFDGVDADKWGDDERPDLWTNDLDLPGSTQMKYLRAFMETVSWWKLEPHPEWVSTVPESNAYCAAVPGEQYVVYCTGGAASVPVLVMITEGHGERYEGQWYNPRTGEWSEATGEYHGYGCGWLWRACMPDYEDWLLCLKRSVGGGS
jgi:hypothetical protein